jgi:CubicO group peptidase (beta-lactamase class C family)
VISKRGIIVGGLLLVAGGSVYFAMPLLSIATAYKAKTLCSEVFVAGRDPDSVLHGLAIDDLAALRAVSTDVNRRAATTTASLVGLARRRAQFRDDLGCALVSHSTAEQHSTREPSRERVAALPAATTGSLEAAIDSAFIEPDAEHLRRTRAVVVLQHGAVVAERYAPGYGPETPMPGWSMTKSVLNALIGVAVKEGALLVDAPTKLRAWSAPGDPRQRITLGDMLRMSSGLEFHEDAGDPHSDLLRMLFESPDMAAFAASKPLSATPGTRWKYSTGTAMIVSRVLREALGDARYREFPRQVLFEPLGLTHATLEADESGTFVASSYMYATAREWARFGQLYLQDGVWNGTRILPEGWVKYTRTPAPAAPAGTYGAHFWLATPREYRGPPVDLPSDMFQSVGHEGQFITIIPSRDVVIVRLGRTRVASAWAHDRFVASILAAVER